MLLEVIPIMTATKAAREQHEFKLLLVLGRFIDHPKARKNGPWVFLIPPDDNISPGDCVKSEFRSWRIDQRCIKLVGIQQS